MDKKLTDSEIVKALEESISFDEPYESDFTLIRIKYIKNALDLINRLQAKNKNLQERNVILRGLVDTQKAENERLKEKQEKCFYCTEQANKKIGEIKAEAYKEFAERLKEKSKKTEIVCSGALITTNYSISDKNFNNLLKELVGEDNAE